MPGPPDKDPGKPEKDPGKGESSTNTNITVAVRVRPLSLKEKERQSWATVEVLDDDHVLVRGSRAPARPAGAPPRVGSGA